MDAAATSSAGVWNGVMVLERMSPTSNTWAMHGTSAFSSSVTGTNFAGSKDLSAALDRVKIDLSAGTFSAGATWSVILQ